MEKVNCVKGIIATIGAFLAEKLGILWIIIPMLLACSIVDYITGMLAAKKEGAISSKTGMWGIVKKLLYYIEVTIAILIDWTIINVAKSIGVEVPITTFFGLLVAIWIMINELVSILENLTRLETPMPSFLVRIVSNLKIAVEKSGDKLADSVSKDSKE